MALDILGTRAPAAGLLMLALFALGCSDEDKLVRAACQQDSDCTGGLLCDNSVCVEPSTKSCEVVTEGNPILQPTPHAVAFGELEVQETVRTIELHNLGNCTLTLFEANLQGNGPGSASFHCDACTGPFPIEIFPGRKKDVQLSFKAQEVGKAESSLVILSDDKEFPELRIPLSADFRGVPNLRVAPSPVDFGYVAQGRVSKKVVQVTNQGTGVANVTLHSISLSPADSTDFALGASATLDEPVTLQPVIGDTNDILSFDVQYHPRSVGTHAAELVLATNKGEMRVQLTGNSATPPKLTFSPESVDLGQVTLGQTQRQKLTLVNEGGAPLEVKLAWGGSARSNSDLFVTPQVIPAIAPGAYVEVDVSVTASAPGAISGLLVLSSNDPGRPSATVPVSATGVVGPGPEVVKIEMFYENGSDSAFDSDLRNVDLTLEHPFGYICNKGTPAPKDWGAYGTPSWLAFAPKEEPERIILADATKDGTYQVSVQYMEDCKALPTELLAGLLGISVDALVVILSEGIINVNGQDIGDLIAKVCVNRAPTNVSVRVFVNGEVKGEKSIALDRRGDFRAVLELVRSGGTFTVK